MPSMPDMPGSAMSVAITLAIPMRGPASASSIVR